MSRQPSIDLENSSEIPTWIVLICSGLALMMFFGWIAKDLSVLVSPDQAGSRLAQPLSESGTASDYSGNAIELASSHAIRRAPSNNSPSSKSGTERLDSNDSPAPGPSETSMAHSTPRTVAQAPAGTPETGQPGTGQVQPSVRRKDADRTSNQRAIAELPETSRNSQQDDPAESESSATPSRPQPVTTRALADVPDKAPLETADATATTPSQTPPPASTDLGALRQLLAEAAAVNETADGQVRSESEELETLSELSASIQFEPGSKVTSESATSALDKIQQILTDDPETTINVVVATNESGNEKQDTLLSQERGRALIARLVNSGLAFSRFSLTARTGDQLPANTHKVEIQAHTES